jgi:hypothetical protein
MHFYVGHSRTVRALYFGRSFMENDDPKPVVAKVKQTLKIYPYTPGSIGTSIATALEGNVMLAITPARALDPELTGQLAAIGIVKGKPFAPDARMKKILTEAVNVANATARTLNMNPREAEGFAYYPGSAWFNWLFVGGYNFETPPPMVTKEGIKPFPPTGARTLNSRTTMFIGYTASPLQCVCG